MGRNRHVGRRVHRQADREKGIAILPFDRGFQGVRLGPRLLEGEAGRAVREIEGGKQEMLCPRLPLLVVQGMSFSPLAEALDRTHVAKLRSDAFEHRFSLSGAVIRHHIRKPFMGGLLGDPESQGDPRPRPALLQGRPHGPALDPIRQAAQGDDGRQGFLGIGRDGDVAQIIHPSTLVDERAAVNKS